MSGDKSNVEPRAPPLHGGLVYAPPFSPVWDPVVTAAREVAKKL